MSMPPDSGRVNPDAPNGNPDIRLAALAAIKAGLCVCPPREDGSKAPDGMWKEFQARRSTVDDIHRWYGTKGPPKRTGLGLVCGKVSEDLEVFEFDARGEAYGAFKAAAVAVGLGKLVERIEAGYLEQSPSLGIHWLYHCETIAGNTKLASRYKTPEEFTEADRKAVDAAMARGKEHKPVQVLIETRGEGGYIVVAPSNGTVHPSGQPYEVLTGGFDTIATITPEERESLLNLARSFDRMPEPDHPDPAETKASKSHPRDGPDTITPWDDFNARARWSDLLAGWAHVHDLGETQYWRRPGKDEGVSATVNRGGSDRLFVFSTSTEFEPQKPYTKFGAFARLEHRDDVKAAARALSEAGYGTSRRTANGHATANGQAEEDEDESEVIDRWPKLDPHAFHGVNGELVWTIDPQSEADPVATLIQFLVAFGNMAGRGPHFKVGATRHHLNLLVALVGATALGRKGTSWDGVKAVLGPCDPLWEDYCIKSGLASGEGLIHHVRDEVRDEEDRVQDPGVRDKRLLVIETELSRPFKLMNRETNILSDVLRQVFDSGNLSTLVKNNPTKATGAHVSLIGHTTQADIRRHLSETDTLNGFANRLLWPLVRRSKLLPEGGDFDSVDWQPIRKRVREAAEFARGIGKMTRDHEASAIWAGVYPQLSGSRSGLLGAVTNRAEALTMRLACLFALLDLSPVVRAVHLLAALALWEYCEASARLTFGESQGDATADKLLMALKAAPGGLSRNEIRESVFQKNKSAAVIRDLLSDLLTQGLIHRKSDRDTGGRPAERWFDGRG